MSFWALTSNIFYVILFEFSHYENECFGYICRKFTLILYTIRTFLPIFYIFKVNLMVFLFKHIKNISLFDLLISASPADTNLNSIISFICLQVLLYKISHFQITPKLIKQYRSWITEKLAILSFFSLTLETILLSYLNIQNG